MESLDVNCTNTCLATGIITHRIVTQVPSFTLGYYRRETTLLSKVQADVLRTKNEEEAVKKSQEIKNEVQAKSTTPQTNKRSRTRRRRTEGTSEPTSSEASSESNDASSMGLSSSEEIDENLSYGSGMDDQYGMARKQPGTTGTCYVNQLPYLHPACINERRDSSNTTNSAANSTNATVVRRALQLSEPSDHRHRYLNIASEEYKQQQQKVQERLDRIESNNIFSYCPVAEDPCKWLAIAWEVPLGPRPLGELLIAIVALQWTIFTILLWLWLPTIARAILQRIVRCVSALKERTERYKTDPTLQSQGKWGQQKQLCLIRIKRVGENWMSCCMKTHRNVLLCGAKLGCVDPLSIPSILGSNENEDSDSDDSEFDAVEAIRIAEKNKSQKLWDQLVHALSKAVQRKKTVVNLSRMYIEKLPSIASAGKMTFQELNLSENVMKNIDLASPLLTLKGLMRLFLMDNSLLSLPDMTALTSLVLLDVDGNDLGRGQLNDCVLPNSLERLYMNRNALLTFPECTLSLDSLQWLYLAHNKMTDVSEAIPKPVGDEKDEQGKALLSSCGLSCRLKRLVLSHNSITKIPLHISSLCQLEELWMSENRIVKLPETLCLLSNLHVLLMDDNLLQTLPKDLGLLTNLVELDVHTNHLTSVPESLLEVSTVEKLIFRNNSITDLPHWVGNLKTVKYLDYTKNSIPVDCAQETLTRLKINNPYVVEAKFF